MLQAFLPGPTTPRRMLAPLGAATLLAAVGLVALAGCRREDAPAPAARLEIVFEVRPYPEDPLPSHRGDAIRIRLDADRLRALGLSADDVRKAFTPSGIVDSSRRVEPPPGVVFVPRLSRPEPYENLVLRADAQGNVVRLKDVGKVEFVPAEPGPGPPRGR